jgi:hypothetical protein
MESCETTESELDNENPLKWLDSSKLKILQESADFYLEMITNFHLHLIQEQQAVFWEGRYITTNGAEQFIKLVETAMELKQISINNKIK